MTYVLAFDVFNQLYVLNSITIPGLFGSEWSTIFPSLSSALEQTAALSSVFGAGEIPEASTSITTTALSVFAGAKHFLLSLGAIILLTALFGRFHTKLRSAALFVFVTRNAQRFWLIGAAYYATFLTLRFILEANAEPQAYLLYIYSVQLYYSHVIGLVFLLILAGLHLFSVSVLSSSKQTSPEVALLAYLVACFGWVLLEVSNFALFLVCLEGFSLTLYILATTGRLYGGVSAAIKYFAFGTLGSIFLYWGALSIFELTATMSATRLSDLVSTDIEHGLSTLGTYSKAILAQSLILGGFLIKLGAAPLHQWVADVYAGVPLFITAFYATFVKLVLFILFLGFATSFVSVKEVEFASLTSLVVGCFGTLRQVDVKRFLAYGSIAHTGYLLMGDLTATYTYLATYILASFLFFSVLLNTRLNGREIVHLSDLRFIGQSENLLDRSILVIALASMAGLPPFGGFYGKMLVWISLMEDIYFFNDTWSYLLLTANLLTSLIMMFYYMRVMCILYVNDESVEPNVVVAERGCDQELITSVQCLGIALLVLWTVFMPSFLTLLNQLC